MVCSSGSTRHRHAERRQGFALEAVLLLLLMFTVIVLVGVSAVTSVTRSSGSDYRSSRVSYASEGGADDIMSQLDAAMQDGIINNEDIGNLQSPVLQGFRFVHSTRAIGAPVSRTINSGPFAGLYSLNQPIDISVEARDSSSNRATSILSVNAQTIPLFQFGVFYENDLEILPGQPMTFAGWVHTNGNLYLSSASAQFQSQITTPDSVFWQRKDRSERLSGVTIFNASATPNALDFDSRSHAGAAFVTRSQQKFSGRLMTGAHGVRPLKLPLPSDLSPITLVEPRSAGDVQMVQDVKMAWKADWYIIVRAGLFRMSDTVAMKAAVCDSLVQIRDGGMLVPSGAVCRRIFKPRVDAFYEGREDRRPDFLDIHMDSLRIWADADPAARAPRIIYIAFENVVNDSRNDLLAVRLRQGAKLPRPKVSSDTGGLTIVTDRPLYVLGDYNTTVWRPAALMGDAVTFLSNPATAAMSGCTSSTTGWCDSQQQNMAQRTSRTTTVNAAILAGHSPTSCDWQRLGCSSPAYGGGLENFPRFLENWSGVTFRYTGSLVSLYTSRFVNGLWGNTANTGFAAQAYYSAPTRDWQFDVNFRFPERLPPGTPSVGTVIQTAFRPVY